MRVELAIFVCLVGLIVFAFVSITNEQNYIVTNECVKTGNSKMVSVSYYSPATKNSNAATCYQV